MRPKDTLLKYTYLEIRIPCQILLTKCKQCRSTKDKKPIHNVNLTSTQQSKNQKTKVPKNFSLLIPDPCLLIPELGGPGKI